MDIYGEVVGWDRYKWLVEPSGTHVLPSTLLDFEVFVVVQGRPPVIFVSLPRIIGILETDYMNWWTTLNR